MVKVPVVKLPITFPKSRSTDFVILIGSTTVTLAVMVEVAEPWEKPWKKPKRNKNGIVLFILEKQLN
jgi:hypothetical protein